jgi:hypothetical protein
MIKDTAVSLFVNPFAAFAILLALWGLWRLTRWFAAGGRMPLRGRRGKASGFSGAALAVDAFYRPGAKQVIEAQLREETNREDDDEGDGLCAVPVKTRVGVWSRWRRWPRPPRGMARWPTSSSHTFWGLRVWAPRAPARRRVTWDAQRVLRLISARLPSSARYEGTA